MPDRHQARRTQPIDRLGRRRVRKPSSQARGTNLVGGRRRMTDTGDDVAYDVAVDAGLVHALLQQRVEQAVGRGVTEGALLGARERGSFGKLQRYDERRFKASGPATYGNDDIVPVLPPDTLEALARGRGREPACTDGVECRVGGKCESGHAESVMAVAAICPHPHPRATAA